jgi:hypothetical protein
MEEDTLFTQRQSICNHGKERLYRQRQFDILNGYEYNFTRCLNCHKILRLEAKKFVK